jgi:RNA polymerase sigma factor (sigma-70 family)
VVSHWSGSGERVAVDQSSGEGSGTPCGDTSDSAFADVYAAQLASVSRLAFLVVRSRAVAEELAQDAFTVLLQHFAEVENPPAYLRTTVVRLALRWQDRRRMEQQRLELIDLPRHQFSPEIDETWEAIGRLSVERQVVLVLRFYEDLGHEEIAALLGCTAGTVRSRVRRALSDLRKELDG